MQDQTTNAPVNLAEDGAQGSEIHGKYSDADLAFATACTEGDEYQPMAATAILIDPDEEAYWAEADHTLYHHSAAGCL